jgi:aminoglycoside 6-adenylyltransferase
MNEPAQIDKFFKQLEDNFIMWSKKNKDVRGAIVVGSRARTDHPADEWSDLDIIIFTNDPDSLLTHTDWIYNIGEPILSFVEQTAGLDKELRVLFKEGLDVDFAISDNRNLLQLQNLEDASQILEDPVQFFGRGIRIIVDKDGLLNQFKERMLKIPRKQSLLPKENEFFELINDFLYHCVFTAKKLRREELWFAKQTCDDHLKSCLLKLIEWYTQIKQGKNYDIWYRGRFLDTWADQRILNGLRNAFAYYNIKDIWRALFETLDLFSWIAKEVAEKMDFSSFENEERYIRDWIQQCYSNKSK